MNLLSFSQVIMGAETLTRAINARVLRIDIIAYCTSVLFLGFIIYREILRSVLRTHTSKKMQPTEYHTSIRPHIITEHQIKFEQLRRLEDAAKLGEISQGLLHDLISPLTSISLYIEHFNDTQPHSKESVNALLQILDISRRMYSFSEHVKSYLRIENCLQNSDMTDLVKELEMMRDILSFKARKAGIELRFYTPPTLIIPVNHVRIHQVISNLMTNALESYECPTIQNNHKKYITVRVTQDAQSVKLSVTDTGCGIPPDTICHIFKKPFTTKKHGTGCGLIIIRSIVEEEFGGNIVVHSNPKVGTTFTITIPCPTTYSSHPSQICTSQMKVCGQTRDMAERP